MQFGGCAMLLITQVRFSILNSHNAAIAQSTCQRRIAYRGELRQIAGLQPRHGQQPGCERLTQRAGQRGQLFQHAHNLLGAAVARQRNGVEASAADRAEGQQVAQRVAPLGVALRQDRIFKHRQHYATEAQLRDTCRANGAGQPAHGRQRAPRAERHAAEPLDRRADAAHWVGVRRQRPVAASEVDLGLSLYIF